MNHDYDAQSITVRVGVLQHLPFREIAPLLDALNEHHLHVEVSRWNMEPPAAGDIDVSLTLVIDAVSAFGGVAISILLKTFLEEFAKDTYGAVRREFLRVFKKSPRATHGWRHYVPMQLHARSVRFYFSDPEMTDQEFCERIRAAIDVADSLPEDGYEEGPGPGPEYGLEWNEDSRSWRGLIWMKDGDLFYVDGKLEAAESEDVPG